jgi:hypothetical protein
VKKLEELDVLRAALFGEGRSEETEAAHASSDASLGAPAEASEREGDERAEIIEAVRAAKKQAGLPEDCDLAAQGWGVHVVGHSLGAGVGAIVALLLRAPKFGIEAALQRSNSVRGSARGVRAIAVSCPLATVTPALADEMKDFTTTVVLGKDVVCRGSVRGLEEQRNRCVVRRRSLPCALGSAPPSRAYRRPSACSVLLFVHFCLFVSSAPPVLSPLRCCLVAHAPPTFRARSLLPHAGPAERSG